MQVDFDAIRTIIDCFICRNDNLISASVSEAVEKIPTDEKDYRKCSLMCLTLHNHSSYKE